MSTKKMWNAQPQYISAEHKMTTGQAIIWDTEGNYICQVPQKHAPLIAAAPLLLAHLKVMCEMAMYASPAKCGRGQADIDVALHTIAKAEGN